MEELNMGNRFESKVVIVTGGASGIGKDAAVAFGAEGAKVVVADIANAEETVGQIKETGGEAVFVRTDVRKAPDVQSMVGRCIELYGGVDYAFNNAGISGAFSALADYDPQTWSDVIAVNLTGVFLSMKYEIPEMIRRGGGAIVNLSSAAGIKSSSDVGPAYNASKHGVVGLSKGAAVQYADRGIRINVVCPGLIRTPLSERTLLRDEPTARAIIGKHPIGRVGEPREVTSLVLWLCSDESSFVTGAIIPVDGGLILA
jgi:NAD(P)-dependent dehydrogenase (short-subunit alcohol dehydrogenase family)